MSSASTIRRAQTAHQSPLAAARACGCAENSLPAHLLELHISLDGGADLPLSTLGVGFEQRTWRAEALARHIIDWVPDFALRPAERDLEPGRVMDRLRRAYRATFGNGTDRGVPAEILLHAVCRELYGSSTLVNKVCFKTADNDTYKGFDGAHCVHAVSDSGAASDELELWLGEAKFYKSLKDALRDAASDLEAHLDADYLRREFAIVSNKIDDTHPHAAQVRELMHPNTRLEDVFERIVIPIFVTYESSATKSHFHASAEYLAELDAEAHDGLAAMRNHLEAWRERKRTAGDPAADLRVQARLFLLPMADKKRLIEEIDRGLAWLL